MRPERESQARIVGDDPFARAGRRQRDRRIALRDPAEQICGGLHAGREPVGLPSVPGKRAQGVSRRQAFQFVPTERGTSGKILDRRECAPGARCDNALGSRFAESADHA
jgi:hypothetical protein